MSKTITALYQNISDARAAIETLLDHGYEREDISLIVPDPDGTHGETLVQEGAEGENPRDGAAVGAIAGGALGGIAGLLLGVSVFSLPVLGAAVIAGPIYTAFMGATAGGAGGSLLGWLVEKGIPEKRAKVHAEALRRGHTLVSVDCDNADFNEVGALLRRHGALDIDKAEKTWRSEGWDEDDNPPDVYKPEEDDKNDQHRFATGAMGSDVKGSRNRPPLSAHEENA